LLATCAAPTAQASSIFWRGGPGIGSASLDGTGVNNDLITANAFYVAVDGTSVYWTDTNGGTIGRTNLDGTGVNQKFIALPSSSDPLFLAVDGTHIYWTDTAGIGRANLDGTGVDQGFISGANLAGLAVDQSHIWFAQNGSAATTIGRANLDGTGVNQSFISMANSQLLGMAVDGAHIYWASGVSGAESIGRANLDGTGVNQSFIGLPSAPIGVAVSLVPEPATSLLVMGGVLGLGVARRRGALAHSPDHARTRCLGHLPPSH